MECPSRVDVFCACRTLTDLAKFMRHDRTRPCDNHGGVSAKFEDWQSIHLIEDAASELHRIMTEWETLNKEANR